MKFRNTAPSRSTHSGTRSSVLTTRTPITSICRRSYGTSRTGCCMRAASSIDKSIASARLAGRMRIYGGIQHGHSRGDHRTEFCRRLDAGGDGAGAGAAPGGDLFQKRRNRQGIRKKTPSWTRCSPIWRRLRPRTRSTRRISQARTSATLTRPCACCGTASTCCWKSRAF